MGINQSSVLRLPQADVQIFSAQDVKGQINLIQDIMRSVMKENEHYGIIPGCNKPTLYKPGAEKLGLTFRLAPYFEGENTPIYMPNGHIKYTIKCTLKHIQTDQIWGQGVGSCSSMESKFRYRWLNTKEKPSKEEAARLIEQGDGKWKKYNNNWTWQKRTENPDIADVDNTILKMAKKRAHVDAMLSATGASDIFTQDVEDMEIVQVESEKTDKDQHQNGVEQPGKNQKTQPAAALENEAIIKMKAEASKVLADLKELGELSDEKYKASVAWFKVAKKEDAIKSQLEKIKAMLPPDQQPLKIQVNIQLSRLSGNDVVKSSSILKDAVIYWNTRQGADIQLEIISSPSQIKEDQAGTILKAIELYEKEALKKNGKGAAKADPKPAQNVSQPIATPQKEVEAAI